MLHVLAEVFKPVIRKTAREIRKKRGLTIERMSEELGVAPRSYGDLERGKYCFSSAPLICLEIMMTDGELLLFIHELRKCYFDSEEYMDF